MGTPELDELDKRLIDLLAQDARVSNRRIAALLGVTEGTVRGRIKRLQQDNLIRFTAVTAPRMMGSPRLVFIYVSAEPARVREIALQISELPSVNSVLIMLGRYNILVNGLFRDLEDSMDIASNQILSIKGVQHVETSIAVNTVKYNARIAKITHSAEVIEDDGNS